MKEQESGQANSSDYELDKLLVETIQKVYSRDVWILDQYRLLYKLLCISVEDVKNFPQDKTAISLIARMNYGLKLKKKYASISNSQDAADYFELLIYLHNNEYGLSKETLDSESKDLLQELRKTQQRLIAQCHRTNLLGELNSLLAEAFDLAKPDDLPIVDLYIESLWQQYEAITDKTELVEKFVSLLDELYKKSHPERRSKKRAEKVNKEQLAELSDKIITFCIEHDLAVELWLQVSALAANITSDTLYLSKFIDFVYNRIDEINSDALAAPRAAM